MQVFSIFLEVSRLESLSTLEIEQDIQRQFRMQKKIQNIEQELDVLRSSIVTLEQNILDIKNATESTSQRN